MNLNAVDTIADELITAREIINRAESRFAEVCDDQIERNHFAEAKAVFEGGATRSVKEERYDLIPPEIEIALARRFGLGAEKHGDWNWTNGGAEFIASCLNHLRAHYVSLRINGPFNADDDIGAMLWNAGVLAWFRVHKPDEFIAALRLEGNHDAIGVEPRS